MTELKMVDTDSVRPWLSAPQPQLPDEQGAPKSKQHQRTKCNWHGERTVRSSDLIASELIHDATFSVPRLIAA